MSIWHAAAVLEGDRVFRLEERFEPDGTLRLMLIGELDVAAIDHLSVRLRELRKGGYPVRLDLSQLQFIDSSGIPELIREVTDARRDRWALDVDGPMTEPVARTVDLVGARSFFWPDEG
ncbi:MAG TPA: STAS domain-containing protein [Solirubrobacteraceae bacterium]|nr:STAS domain-containing protein [Solirubrobacteraceae bacterium]